MWLVGATVIDGTGREPQADQAIWSGNRRRTGPRTSCSGCAASRCCRTDRTKQDRRGNELVIRSKIEDPMTALASATRDNARILGVSDEVGIIEVGKLADLVVWAANPLDDPLVFGDRTQARVVLQRGRVVKDIR